jgi:hypothetical protein
MAHSTPKVWRVKGTVEDGDPQAHTAISTANKAM